MTSKARVWWLLYLTPFAAAVWFVAAYGVNVPCVDEWGLGYLFYQIRTHAANIPQMFWSANNEHRWVVPKLIFTGLAFADGWNPKLEMFVTLAIALAMFAALVRLARLSAPAGEDGGWLFPLSVLASGALLFSFVHYDTWLSGFQMVFLLPFALTAGALLMVSRPEGSLPARLGAAAALCFLASFSAAHGLLSWIAVLIFLALMRRSREAVISACVLAGLFLLSLFLYTRGGITKAATGADPAFLLHHTAAGAWFFFALLGAPEAQGLGPAVTPAWLAPRIGILLAAAFLAALIAAARSRRLARAAPWISMGLLAGGFSLLTTFGRAGWGAPVAATQSRYMIGEVLLAIAVIHLCGTLVPPRALYRNLYAAGLCLLIALAVTGDRASLAAASQIRASRTEGAQNLPLMPYIDPQTDDLPESLIAPLFPFPGYATYVRKPATMAHDVGLLKFADHAAFLDSPPVFCGCLDTPLTADKGFAALGAEDLPVSGWAVIPDEQRVAPVVLLSLDGRRTFIAGARPGTIARPDVAALLKNPVYASAGWSVTIRGRLLPAGEFHLKAWAYDDRRERFLRLADCNGPKRIVKTAP